MPTLTRFRRLLTIITVLMTAATALAQNPPIMVERGKSYEGNLFGLMQEVIVRGNVNGDVGAIGADITVDGTVSGNISVINGSISLMSGAVVQGNILITAGQIQKHEKAQFSGKEITFFTGNKQAEPVSFKSRLALFFAEVLILFLFVLITFYLFPNQIDKAAFELSHDLVKSFSKGLVTIALFLAAIFISFLLIVVAIGFPLFLVFTSGFLVVAGFGAAAVVYRLADVLVDRSGKKLSLSAGMLITAIVLIGCLQLPILSTLTYLIVLVLGVGTVIATRFGTNKAWFTRRSRYY